MKTPTPLLVPNEDLDRPLAARQFPFRAAPACQVGEERAAAEAAEARRAIDETLRAHHGIIVSVALKAGHRRDYDRATIDELVADAMVHLTRYAAPRFDATRGVKVSTFLHHCSSMFAIQWTRAESCRRARSREVLLGEDRLADILAVKAAPDTSLDARIERVAAFVLKHPERYLTPTQVQVFRAILEAPPGTQMTDVAKRLGYKRDGSLWIVKRRIFDRIAEISIEDFEDDAPLREAA
jgi:hypothetical protein